MNCWIGVDLYHIRGTYKAAEQGTFAHATKDETQQAYLIFARRRLIYQLEGLQGTQHWTYQTCNAYWRLREMETMRELSLFEEPESARGVHAGQATEMTSEGGGSASGT